MSQSEMESLSALLDNEADDLELRRLLKSCESNPEIAATWGRYNLVQSLLHHDAVPVSAGMSERIRQEIAAEPDYRGSRMNAWQQNLSKIAIAASVALVVVVGMQVSLDGPAVPEFVQQDGGAGTDNNLLAGNDEAPVDREAMRQVLREYIEQVAINFDRDEPVFMEHIQDSPLYRLVNELQARP